MAESFIIRKNYPYNECLYIKVRENRVLSKSCHIAIGITKDGDREIIGFMIQSGESEETWTTFSIYKILTYMILTIAILEVAGELGGLAMNHGLA